MSQNMVSGSIVVAPPKDTRWGEPYELSLGDLCIWVGKQTEYSPLSRRVIYQVIDKEDAATSSWSKHVYKLAPAFDLENPIGTSVEPVSHNGTRDMKRLSLLDIATIRLHYDNFIKQWARHAGQCDPDDVR